MGKSKKLNVILFALTGFGNPVLQALLVDSRVNVASVFTVKYDAPFPYYEEQQLLDFCNQRGVICHHGIKVGSDAGIALLRSYAPDLIIMATFKQILRQNVLDLPRFGVVNLHPSLLPLYRGPCPSQAALLNDEKETGVTAHYVTELVDEGNILLQRSLVIDQTDNDGQLRQKLASLAGEMIPEVVDLFQDFTKPAGIPQNHHLASLAPKPVIEDGYLEFIPDVNEIRRRVRALNPFPGTSISVAGQRVAVDKFELFEAASGEDGFYLYDDYVDVILRRQSIRLFKKQSAETGDKSTKP